MSNSVLGLNIEPEAESEGPNGALIEVSAAEVERLDVREMRYDRVDVTDAIGVDEFDTVLAWTVKPVHHHPTPPEGAVILKKFVNGLAPAMAEASYRSTGIALSRPVHSTRKYGYPSQVLTTSIIERASSGLAPMASAAFYTSVPMMIEWW